jgi:COP9 signalosome complex subunit 7
MIGREESKLEQYLLLAKPLKDAPLADLITKACSEPGLFNFGELLALPAVQDLNHTQLYSKAYALLTLFSYGTLMDLKCHPDRFPELTELQLHKLRLLTVVSMATSRRTLPYSELFSALDLQDVRQLEDFLISGCLYGGLIKGKPDQKAQCLHVEDALPRDVPPDQLASVVLSLGGWLETARAVLMGIQDNVDWTTKSANKAAASKAAAIAAAAAAEGEKKKKSQKQQQQGEEGASAMVLGDDEEDEGEEEEELLDGRGGRTSKRRR